MSRSIKFSPESTKRSSGREVKHMSRYTTSEDGHIIGHDGFVIPKDFAEFYERFPRHVRGFVYRN